MDPVAVGAFLSGVAAVLSSFYALRATRRRCEDECKARLEAMREGIRIGEEIKIGQSE